MPLKKAERKARRSAPGPKRAEDRAFSAKRQVVWFETAMRFKLKMLQTAARKPAFQANEKSPAARFSCRAAGDSFYLRGLSVIFSL